MKNETFFDPLEESINHVMDLLFMQDDGADFDWLVKEIQEDNPLLSEYEIIRALEKLEDEKVIITVERFSKPGRNHINSVDLTTIGRHHFITWEQWVKKKKEDSEIPKKALAEQVISNNLTATQIIIGIIVAFAVAIIGFYVGKNQC